MEPFNVHRGERFTNCTGWNMRARGNAFKQTNLPGYAEGPPPCGSGPLLRAGLGGYWAVARSLLGLRLLCQARMVVSVHPS